MDNWVDMSVPGIKKILRNHSCVLTGASHLLHTLQSRGAIGHGREGPLAGEQGGQLGTECPSPRDHGDPDLIDPENYSSVLTYYQKKLILFFFFLPLQFRGANVQEGEGPLAEEQGGQLGRQEEPLTVQAKAGPLLTRSKLIIDQDLVSPLSLDRVHRHQERREGHHLQLSSQYCHNPNATTIQP